MKLLNQIVVPETGETVLDNLRNAVSLMALIRDPPRTLDVDLPVLKELLDALAIKDAALQKISGALEVVGGIRRFSLVDCAAIAKQAL